MQYQHISETALARLLQRDTIIENTTFEVKRATGKDGLGKVPDDFYPTYCAMANTLGGTVVFGLDEIKTKAGNPIYKITGIPNHQKVIVGVTALVTDFCNFLDDSIPASDTIQP